MRYQRVSDGKIRSGYPHAFGRQDFADLARFLMDAGPVVPVGEAATASSHAVVLRHDVDHNLDHALRFAEWEADHGIRASYYVLPTAWYWQEPGALDTCRRLQELGHEVGVHQDCVAEAWRQGSRTPVDGSVLPAGNCDRAAEILRGQIAELRDAGIWVYGTSTHGTPLWNSDHITNAFLWAAGYLAEDFGLQYADAYHLHRKALYVSDNRGGWSSPLRREPERQTHVLTHPAHWDVTQVARVAA